MPVSAFHDVRFPLAVAFGATGGPERRTEVVRLGSGREERNQRWAMSRRRYDAGTGVKTRDDLHSLVEFFEERRGRLHGFRFRDPLDHKSCAPSLAPSDGDQVLGVADGSRTDFPLIKTYGDLHAPYERTIRLPVDGTVLVAVGGVATTGWGLSNGVVQFDTPPVAGIVTAGFEFDVPVRFDVDRLEIDYSQFRAGLVPSVPLVEIVL